MAEAQRANSELIALNNEANSRVSGEAPIHCPTCWQEFSDKADFEKHKVISLTRLHVAKKMFQYAGPDLGESCYQCGATTFPYLESKASKQRDLFEKAIRISQRQTDACVSECDLYRAINHCDSCGIFGASP